MTAAEELICTVERNGGRIRVDGEDIVIRPRDAATPIIQDLRRHKAEIIDLLSARPAMPAGVRLLRYVPVRPPIQISSCETALDTCKFIESTLRQVDARLHGAKWLSGNLPLSGLMERLAAVGCLIDLEDRNATLQ